jgi:hypothetical protein
MDRKLKFRKGLNRLYLPIYDFLCDNLPPEWEPYAGVRSIDEQQMLYDQGRIKPGTIVTNAAGGMSPHNYGCATDWIPFIDGKPVWSTPKGEWDLYRDMIDKAGGTYISWDKPHNELPIRVKWLEVDKVRVDKGMEAALQFILGNKQ